MRLECIYAPGRGLENNGLFADERRVCAPDSALKFSIHSHLLNLIQTNILPFDARD